MPFLCEGRDLLNSCFHAIHVRWCILLPHLAFIDGINA